MCRDSSFVILMQFKGVETNCILFRIYPKKSQDVSDVPKDDNYQRTKHEVANPFNRVLYDILCIYCVEQCV